MPSLLSAAELNERLHRDSAWARQPQQPDALAVADGYIEQSLAQVAIDLHMAADQTGAPEQYSRAADLYSQYLNKFPFAKDYYEIQWYLSDTLFKSGRLREAGAEYIQLLKGKDHAYRDGAMWNLMLVRRQVLVDAHGTVEALPTNAVEIERRPGANGQERSIYALSDEHKDFIASADMLMETEFADADYAESLDEARPALSYIPGQILYYHGYLEEARERLHKVIERYPARMRLPLLRRSSTRGRRRVTSPRFGCGRVSSPECRWVLPRLRKRRTSTSQTSKRAPHSRWLLSTSRTVSERRLLRHSWPS